MRHTTILVMTTLLLLAETIIGCSKAVREKEQEEELQFRFKDVFGHFSCKSLTLPEGSTSTGLNLSLRIKNNSEVTKTLVFPAYPSSQEELTNAKVYLIANGGADTFNLVAKPGFSLITIPPGDSGVYTMYVDRNTILDKYQHLDKQQLPQLCDYLAKAFRNLHVVYLIKKSDYISREIPVNEVPKDTIYTIDAHQVKVKSYKNAVFGVKD